MVVGKKRKRTTKNKANKKQKKVKVPKTKAWKVGDGGAPNFPEDNCSLVQNKVLQYTDLKNNNNKYYSAEIHKTFDGDDELYRIYTHFGRTGDLLKNPNAGQKHTRHYETLEITEAAFDKLIISKEKKGYEEINLVATNIGSKFARNKSSGTLDDKTKKAIEEKKNGKPKKKKEKKKKKKKKKVSNLHPKIQELVTYLYQKSTNSLMNSKANITITKNGIATPLGILSIQQVETGEEILVEIAEIIKKQSNGEATNKEIDSLEDLSSDFYTKIPHKLGRNRFDISNSIINNISKLGEKQELCQLLKDCIALTEFPDEDEEEEKTNVLIDEDVDKRYNALNCKIEFHDKKSKEFKRIEKLVAESIKSSHKGKVFKIKNVFSVRKENEEKEYNEDIGNHKLLFHGSKLQHYTGILSRGLLMPKTVVSMGIRRTDAGWLGNGIYYGHADTSYGYSQADTGRKSRFLLIHSVALGKIKDFKKITYGLTCPKGYNSVHGVMGTEFYDHEYCIYDGNQQKMQYFIEVAN